MAGGESRGLWGVRIFRSLDIVTGARLLWPLPEPRGQERKPSAASVLALDTSVGVLFHRHVILTYQVYLRI